MCHVKRYRKGTIDSDDDIYQSDISSIIQHSKPSDTIIVHGIAGIGKTCLMNRIALKWAKKELKHIKYVLLLHTKKIRNHSETAERIICHDLELLPEELNLNIKLILKYDSGKCLILIDGYNELSDEQREYSLLTKLLSREVAKQAVIIVTTRPEGKPYIEKLTKGNYIDLSLRKLDQVGMFTFIRNFFRNHDDYHKSFLQVCKTLMIAQNSWIPEGVRTVPLFLTMLCYLCRQEIKKTGDVKLFHKINGITMGSIVATFWTLLINVKQKKDNKRIDSILTILSDENIRTTTMHMIYVLAKMCFNCLENGETEFSHDVLQRNELNMDCIYDLGPVEIDRGRMVFFHAIFQEYAAAVHITRDDTALDTVLRAYKSRQDNPALFEKYRQALIMAVGIRPAILDKIRHVDLEITLFITEEPEYRLDLSLECDLVHACSIQDDDATKEIVRQFIYHILKAPVSRTMKCTALPEPDRSSYPSFLDLVNYIDCSGLICKVHDALINRDDTCPFDEVCTPRISPPDGGTYQAIRDPILLAALPSVDLGTTTKLGVVCIRPMTLRFLADDLVSILLAKL